MRKNLIWKGEYNYFGYGEGGPSGAPYCDPSSTLPTADYGGSGRALQHAAKYCDERSGLRVHRSSELPCQQRNRWSALRVLKTSVAFSFRVECAVAGFHKNKLKANLLRKRLSAVQQSELPLANASLTAES